MYIEPNPYTQSIYKYIALIYAINVHVDSTHIHNQYTCMRHAYTTSTYMYIPTIYTIDIHVNSSHIQNYYTCT